MLHELYELGLWILFSFRDAYAAADYNLTGTIDDKFFSTAQWIISMLAVGVVVSGDGLAGRVTGLLAVIMNSLVKGMEEEKQTEYDISKLSGILYTLYGLPIVNDLFEEYNEELTAVETIQHNLVWSIPGYSSATITIQTQAFQTSYAVTIPSDFQNRVTEYYLTRSNKLYNDYYEIAEPIEEEENALEWRMGALVDLCEQTKDLESGFTVVAHGTRSDDLAAHLCDIAEDSIDATNRAMVYMNSTAPLVQILESAQGATQRLLDSSVQPTQGVKLDPAIAQYLG